MSHFASQLAEEIETLPASLQEQAGNFIAFLKTRYPQPEHLPQSYQSGTGGELTTLADNFDEPLENPKEHL